MAAILAETLRERDLPSRPAAGTSGVGGGAFLRRLVPEPAAALDDGRGARKIAEIAAGVRTSAVSPARAWQLEGGPPGIGRRLAVFDHLGRRHAVVEVVRVALIPFGEIDAATVDPEPGEPDWHAGRRRAYADCRAEMAALLGDPDWRLTDAEPMVILWFRRVVQETAAPISGSTL